MALNDRSGVHEVTGKVTKIVSKIFMFGNLAGTISKATRGVADLSFGLV